MKKFRFQEHLTRLAAEVGAWLFAGAFFMGAGFLVKLFF